MREILLGTAVLLLLLLFLTPEAGATHCVYQGRQGYMTFYFCPSHSSSPESTSRRPALGRPSLPRGNVPRYPANSASFGELARLTAERHGMDPKLVKAVIAVESGWNPRAVSPKGAAGLMQLMPETARRYGVQDVFDPQENVEAGTRYLKWLIDLFRGNLQLALAAYNAGEEAVMKHNGVPPYPETQEYVPKVLGLLR